MAMLPLAAGPATRLPPLSHGGSSIDPVENQAEDVQRTTTADVRAKEDDDACLKALPNSRTDVNPNFKPDGMDGLNFSSAQSLSYEDFGWKTRGEFLDFYRKPLFHNDGVTRGLLMHLTMLLFSAIVVLPLWLSGSQIDTYYTAPPEFNGTLQTVENGWRTTPIQGHAHRFGLMYQVFVFIHVICGVIVVLLSVILIGFFCTNNKFGVGGNEWHDKVFFIAWVLHLTVAMIMAYCRMITHGMDPCNWTQSFSVGFFALFYFVVLIVLQSLMTILSYQFDKNRHLMANEESERPLSEIGCTRFSTYGTLTMFMLGVFATFTINPGSTGSVMACNPRAADGDYGFDDTNYTILVACIAFGVQPLSAILFERAREIGLFTGWINAFMVELSYLTMYMVTILVEGLNITQKFESNALFVLLPCVILYVIGIGWHLYRVNVTTGLKIEDHGLLFPCWFCLSKQDIEEMQDLIRQKDQEIPAYSNPRTWPCCQFGRGMDAVNLCIGWTVFGLSGYLLGRFLPGGHVNFGVIGMFVGLAIGSFIALRVNQYLEENTSMVVHVQQDPDVSCSESVVNSRSEAGAPEAAASQAQ